MVMRRFVWMAAVLAARCGSGADAGAPERTMVVDSALPPEESLRRLRDGLPEPAALDGAPSRDALVRGLFERLRAQDTAAVVAMTLTRAEFGWLYYPELAAASPTPALDPRLMWTLLRLESEKGLNRLFQRLGGVDVGFEGYRCEALPRTEGRNRLWEDCEVRLGSPPEDLAATRLFGTIIERDGRYKFVSFKTDL